MKTKRALVLLLAVCVIAAILSAAPAEQSPREKAQQTYRDGNYKDAYEAFRKLALDPKDDPGKVGDDLKMATDCLRRLNRTDEVDEFREAVIAVHKDNWRLLFAAAQNIINSQPWGYIIAGEFHRGRHRGGGRYVNCIERDRVRALQLMTDAMKKSEGEKDARSLGRFHLVFANHLLHYRGHSQAWRLQYLTDLTTLPDYDEGGYYGRNQGAPVHPDGTPVFHYEPKSWDAAKTDGERWRWLLLQARELNPGLTNRVRLTMADFLRGQFGVQTMAYYAGFFRGQDSDEEDTSGTYELHTLGEDETITKLAIGIRRFELPDEFNFIKIYRQIADDNKTGHGENALNNLAQVFENRRQYDKATENWKRSIKEYGPGHNNWKQKRVDQILGNWGMFEPIMTQPAGKGATVEFRFRNGTQVSFEAHTIDVKKLLDDVKAYIKTRPNRLDWEKVNINNIGWRIFEKNQRRYVLAKVAGWDLDLKPRPMHFDRRITVTTPLQKAGAYLLTGKMKDGNTSNIIIWLDDTVILKKPLAGQTYYFVADAVTGEPVPKANVEFFGYRQRHVKDRQYTIDIQHFAEFTDPDGQIFIKPKQMPRDHQWLAIATTEGGRFAYTGFDGVWYRGRHDAEYNRTRTFVVTDRPVYRPKQAVKFKFWVRHAKYDREDTSDFANQKFFVRVNDPKGEKIFEKAYTTDAWGGLDGELPLEKDATLGVYRISLWRTPTRGHLGASHFRVEEYKKPEFEVTVEAPTEPVMLGEKIPATVRAKYYFGAPVVKAKVKYKVLRYDYSADWYPIAPWDWFYGRGYWWFAYDYTWYPGWRNWGCKRPHFVWWRGWQRNPPEVVMENEVEIGPEGTVEIEIDSGIAKELHGDTDHRYEITAEVVDESRRTIVGTGSVMVARKPFKVYAWVDRGHYRVGDVVRASFNAQTIDNKPVKGKGKLTLFKITYDKDNKPVEAAAEKWDLDTDEQGRAAVQIKAADPGQYRLSYKLTDAKDHTIEGGYVFCIRGEGFDGAGFRFNDIELVTDKREYAPGEKVNLMVNTNRVGSTVLLFVRPTNGVYLAPKVIRMKGKSVTEEIEVVKKDMPNFFIEAVTISGAKVYSEVREIIVPPEKRVLKLEVVPSAEKYKPGEKATVKIKLTDFFGEPFTGSLVASVYDKSVEYISGGSNVPEIKEFFWKWRRGHYPRTYSSLARSFRNMVRRGKQAMQFIGVFGYSVPEEAPDSDVEQTVAADAVGNEARQMRAGRGGAPRQRMMDAAAAPMAEEGMLAKSGASRETEGDAAGGGAGAAAAVEPTVRKEFADTAFWTPSLTTDDQGNASFELTMPENLTGWKIKVWAMGHGTKVGQAEVEVVTFKNLLLRMQAPRFFVEKDEVVLSANIHNYLENKKSVRAVLELDGGCLEPMGKLEQTVAIDAGGEQRVDWRVKVVKEGEAVVRMKALTDEESDAMEMRFPVYVHGMLKMESWSGVIRPEQDSGSITINVPAERRINESRLEVRYSPTLAGAMVDALPYMVEYPYGCTEQTLNRFLPTVITQKILLDMKLDLKDIRDKQTNLNAQEIGDDVKRAQDWERLIGTHRWDGKKWVRRNPVFDEAEVAAMVKEGVKKLTAMQLGDGGWGWFSGWGERSYPHTTAYVVHGLQIARENGVALVPGVLDRGVQWLKGYQDEQVVRIKNAATRTKPWKNHADNLDAFVYMVLVDADVANAEMMDFLYRDRTKLAVYAKAMFGMALHKQKQEEKLAMMVRNIDQFLVQDDENQTAFLKLPANNWWWHWYGSEYEAQAYYLKLLSRVDPKGEKASRLVKYLLNNRRHATYWNSTRDTSICIEAFADYLRATDEHKPDLTIEVLVDGKKMKEVRVTSENLFSFDNKFVLVGDAVETGKHKIELRKKGTGTLYFNAYLTNFTLEDFIKKAGLEIKVERDYYKLVKVEKTIKVEGAHGQALDQKVEKYERQNLDNLAELKSGDLVEVELVIDSKNDYEYVVFEDMKPAGFEPVEVRSGYTADGLGAYMELRDERVVFFLRQVARGRHSVAYRMRAEIPGKFSALPTRAYAMYAPELKANSDEIKLTVED